MQMNIDALVEISRFYGCNPEYVMAGGGNTSLKNDNSLFVKASGSSLAEAAVDSFVEMDRKILALVWKKTYPESGRDDPFGSRRESAVLSDMMAAKKSGQDQKRPSVEALLHDIMPFSCVVHLHPALVNGLSCSMQGEEAVKELFGEDVIWIPSANPGYVLAGIVKKAMDAFNKKHSRSASVIFLQNHGVFVGADNTDSVKEQYSKIILKISAMIKRKPDFSYEQRITGSGEWGIGNGEQGTENREQGAVIMKTLSELAGAAAFMQSAEISALTKDRSSFAPVCSAFTPDHIVYAGSNPLFSEAATADEIRGDWESHVQKTGRSPKIIGVKGLGVFSAAVTEKAAQLALDLFKDAVKVAVYAESFGGGSFMLQDKIDFINNWEVERFRSAVSIK